MGTPPHLLEDLRDHVLWLTLNRPEQRNAISPEMVCRLADSWQRAGTDPEVRVVVITGSAQSFSAGADMKLLIPLIGGDRPPENEWDERVLSDPEMAASAFLRRKAFPKPIVAAINGVAAGGGLELILATTLRVAAASARFGLSEVKRGLIPGGGGVARLPRQIPQALAYEILLTGDLFDAERAASAGLVNHVVPDELLVKTSQDLAERIAANGPLATRLILDAISRADGLPVERALEFEDEAFARALNSADAAEGVRAFMEKRPAQFVGE